MVVIVQHFLFTIALNVNEREKQIEFHIFRNRVHTRHFPVPKLAMVSLIARILYAAVNLPRMGFNGLENSYLETFFPSFLGCP